jgi:hypothetical protein
VSLDVDDEEPCTTVNVEIEPRVSDVAEAAGAIARRRSLFDYVAMTVFCLLVITFLAPVFWFSFGRGATVGGGLCWLFPIVLAFAWIPWVRAWTKAIAYKLFSPALLAPYTLVRFTRHTLYTRQGDSENKLELGSFPIRAETRNRFAFGTRFTDITFSIPKRALKDPEALSAFRTAFECEPRDQALADVVRVFSESVSSDAVRYTLEPTEQMRGRSLLVRAGNMRFVYGGAGVLLLCALLDLVWNDGVEAGALALGALVLFALYVRLRVTSYLRRNLTRVTLEFGADSLRVTSRNGSWACAWSKLEQPLEDEKVIVLVFGKGAGIVVPKRVLDVGRLETLRLRIAERTASSEHIEVK